MGRFRVSTVEASSVEVAGGSVLVPRVCELDSGIESEDDGEPRLVETLVRR